MTATIRITDPTTIEALSRLATEDIRTPIEEMTWLVLREYRQRGGNPGDIVAEAILKVLEQSRQAAETQPQELNHPEE